MRSVIRLLLLLLLATSALAEDEGQAPWAFNFYLENDLFVNTDKAYTNGIGVNWISPDLSSFSEDQKNLPPLLQELSGQLEGLHPSQPNERRRVVVSLTQKMYTPDDPLPDYLLSKQRPYAGWLYVGLGFHSRRDHVLDTVEVNLGIVGPAAMGKEAQDFIHDVRGIPRFNGWQNQIRNELGLQLIWERKIKWAPEALRFGAWQTDLISHWGISLGNVATHANSGAELRFGLRLPDDFGTSSLRTGGNNSAPFATKSQREISAYLFISSELRAKAWDITLDGNSFSKRSHHVDKRHLVGEAAIGASLVWQRLKLSIAQVFLTREYHGQAQNHGYGSVAITYLGSF